MNVEAPANDDGEHAAVSLHGADGRAYPAQLMLEAQGDRCCLTLRWEGGTLTAAASDYFDAFAAVRRQLPSGVMPRCYGASRNVWPSRMARDMGQGLKAYRMTMGRQASMADLRYIFDSGPDVEPCMPEEQEAFFEAWLDSPRI
ncbi:MAG TPA: hypothetical protein VGN52_05385 [Burkholderiales bacterium]|jgi:hypothetical protein